VGGRFAMGGCTMRLLVGAVAGGIGTRKAVPQP
jgi:hypothetical protein